METTSAEVRNLKSLPPNGSTSQRSQFVRFFKQRREMMLICFLQFLDFEEILKLSLTCKEMRNMIDPHATCFCESDDGRSSLTKYQTHLKTIAARQLLDNPDDLTFG